MRRSAHVLQTAAAVGVLTALLGGCDSEPTAEMPELDKSSAAAPLTISPAALFFRMPGASKSLTATVQYSGLMTATSSDPGCATVNPTATTSKEKPEGTSVYVAQFTVTGVSMRGCTITVTDKKGDTASVRVSVSPIAFICEPAADMDGQNPTPLISGGSELHHPSWSPDGTKIAFGGRLDGPANLQIYAMDADGQHPTQLTEMGSNESRNTYPAWR